MRVWGGGGRSPAGSCRHVCEAHLHVCVRECLGTPPLPPPDAGDLACALRMLASEPAASSALTISTWPRMADQCSAVLSP